MATNQTPKNPANAERRGYWAGLRDGVANGANWMWAHRPTTVSFKWVVLIVIVVALFAFREDIGRFISGNQTQTASLTQADVDRAVAAALAAQNNQTNSCPTGQVETLSFGCIPAGDAAVVLALEGRSNEELEQMLNPDNGNSTTSANPGDTSNSGTADADSTTSAPVSLTCPGGWNVEVPENGQLFPATVWVNNVAQSSDAYSVVYDPDQSGSMDLPAKGWWYQACLPGENRQAHEVALTVVPGEYRFIGPECRVYLNQDGNHPFDQGQLLVNRQNIQRLTIPATTGAENESWLFVRCNGGDASGFSFAKR